ncbi:STAS domain-containing protein [Streptacidiphilus melanogenes]|uniref:STAS domain-containing protein n=1 Tax=Streptacidiphilus melanogenes TaxID=411235 RepID=UPI0005AA888F|nr:STAS domain-containing protein [Streptacidiphilus melanogenes]
MDNPVADPQRLTIAVTDDPRGTVVHVAGELDHDTTAQLQTTLEQALDRADASRLVIDCTAVTFCDSSGLNTLLRTRRSALALQRSLILVAPGRAMVRLLRITGADAALDLAATVPEALARP